MRSWSILMRASRVSGRSFCGVLPPLTREARQVSIYSAALVLAAFTLTACNKPSGASSNGGEDAEVKSLGTVEVTARLVEVPDGAIFQRDLYDYATILKYEVVAVHRGAVEKGGIIYVGHYNPWKPRAEAADKRAKGVGGTLSQFKAGELHRMALETPMDDHFMGGIVDKYFGKHEGPTYWAVWTNPAN
jgi:predicted small secreted protein